MYGESVLLALPLLAVNWAVPPLTGMAEPVSARIDAIAMGVGAGIYEELVFRLALVSLIVIVGTDLLRLDRASVAIAAILLSSLAFAAHHHPPIGGEPFEMVSFAFRTIAGIYLALVFWYRGYGPAAGCHAAYNVMLTCLSIDG